MTRLGILGLLLTQILAAKKPNVLIIIADDLGWNDISLHNPYFHTPNIDSLIKESLHLKNYYVQPICTPTRSVLLSGRYQIHTGLQHGVILGPQPYGMPLGDVLLPEVFKNCGYSNHIVGKWHLGFYRPEMLPENRGFDSHYGYLCGAEDHYTHSVDIMGYSGIDFRDGGKSTNASFGQYGADIYANRIEKLVGSHNFDTDPMFLYAALQNVHYPLQAPQKFVDYFSWIENDDRRHLAAMTMALDESVGRIINAFKNRGVWDDTIVFFTTDNGGSTLFGGNNWPLRGLKNTLWEGGIKGLGSIKLPRGIPGVRDQLTHVSDVFPTLLDMTKCPISSHDRSKLDGASQAKMLQNNTKSSIDGFLINIDPLRLNKKSSDARKWNSTFDVRVQSGLRWKNWKLLTGNPEPDNYPGGRIYPPEWPTQEKTKYVSEKSPSNLRLFNIQNDPFEMEEISNNNKDVVEVMLKMLENFNSTAVPPLWPKADPAADPKLHNGFWEPWVFSEFNRFDNIL